MYFLNIKSDTTTNWLNPVTYRGQPVMVRDFRLHEWIPRTIEESLGPVTYRVQVERGSILKRHIDHIWERLETKEHAM